MFSTREWALGSNRTTVPFADEKAWAEVASALSVSTARLLRARQVHGISSVVMRKGSGGAQPQSAVDSRHLLPADILLTNDEEAALAIQTADCVPLLLADKRTGTVAAAHAGWRGLVAGVPAVTVKALVREFASEVDNVIAAIGPSIGPCCYEVGTDVRTAFVAAGFSRSQCESWFLDRPRTMVENPSLTGVNGAGQSDRWFLDLWQVARDQLALAGVPRANIHVAQLCTASHPEWLCSYRRDGSGAGRLAASIKMRGSAR